MSEWLTKAIERADTISDWLSPKRKHATDLLRATPWPTRKTEAWKYTSLKSIERAQLHTLSEQSATALEAIEGYDAIDLVFVNGCFDATQSSEQMPAGLSVSLLADAPSDVQAENLKAIAQIKPERHLFGLINDALAQDVVRIHVADGVAIENPVRITSIIGEFAEVHTRVLVTLGEESKVTVSEHYQGNVESLNTGFVEYHLQKNARLEHYRFAMQTNKAISVGGSHFLLEAESDLNSTLVGFGSDLSRVDTDIIYAGEKANAKLNAFYLLDGKELFDLHATVEHAVPNCTTLENVRGIVAAEAKAVFNGRIHIHRHAQKTLAELNNRNLLLSNKAEINTKPELEIYADDVRCAHGATIAEIDKQALYYLESRGISRGKAQVMLNFGFINELIDQMPNQVLAEWIRPQIRDRFAKMEISR